MKILFSRSSVYFTIVSYITVDLLAYLQKFYYKSIMNSPSIPHNSIFDEDNQLKIIRRTKSIQFDKRPFCNKVSRFFYKTWSTLYYSVLYYFFPYMFVIVLAHMLGNILSEQA